jgi:hypothetical protein
MDASPASSSCCPSHEHEHAHGHKHHENSSKHSSCHVHPATPSTSTSSSSSSNPGTSGSISSGTTVSPAEGLSLERASQLVCFNAFGDAFEDLAAAAVRGAHMPHSHVGLWPAFALFNHSCVPNTVHYVVGESMVVRATEDVPAGGPGAVYQDQTAGVLTLMKYFCLQASVMHAVVNADYISSCFSSLMGQHSA